MFNDNDRRNKSSIISVPISRMLPIFILSLIFCGLCVSFFWVFYQLPVWAEKQFGPPAPYLTLQQRYLYPMQLFLHQNDLKIPLTSDASVRDFHVDLGESVSSIAVRLEKEGFISNWEALRIFFIYSGMDMSIQAGDFDLSPSMTAIEIAEKLQDATPRDVAFVILPGWRAEEIAALLPTSGLSITADEFLSLISHPEVIAIPKNDGSLVTLEGLLFPGSYTIPRSINSNEFVQILVNRFDDKVSEEMVSAFSSQGLNLQEAITLASIVEREAVDDEEKPLIASVFYNRLRAGMRLESDPTVQYGLGYNQIQQTWWTNPLSAADLAYFTVFNTYLNTGLPPTPICNPDYSSFQAVAYPAESDYYYFQAVCDGSGRHNFARTYEEHLSNSCH